MSGLLILPVAVPLLTAGLLLAAPRRRWLHRVAGTAASLTVLLIGARLLPAAMRGTVPALNVGGWPPGFAITFAADTFSALMLCVSALLVLLGLGFAAATGDDTAAGFTPLALVMSAGAYGALLTADLFNLFVFVEVMLAPSYALLIMTGGRERLSAGRIYITVSLLASIVFLTGIALFYGVTGSVNLGTLAGAGRHGAAVPGAVVLLALATKAAVVPLHGWLPRTYPAAPPAVTVLFSGLLTKVGLYAIIRIYAVVFEGAPRFRWVIMVLALLTMVVGVLGAVGEGTIRGILSFHMVSQIGYILLGLALFSNAGIAAAIFYMVQYILVKAALFACSGTIDTTHGTDRLDHLGGLARHDPVLAGAFMLAALSLAGLPPLSGFVAKLSLVRAAAVQRDYLAVAVAVAVSLLTLVSMIKIWRGAFWGEQHPEKRPPEGLPTVAAARPALLVPAIMLAAPSAVLGILAQPLLSAAAAAAGGLTNIAAYVQAVTR